MCAEPRVWDKQIRNPKLAQRAFYSQAERSQTGKDVTRIQKYESQRLKMENELLRDFLQSVERK